MLKTPIGNLLIQKNGFEIDYTVIAQPLRAIDNSDYFVDARYLILVDTKNINQGDTIKCFIDCDNVKTDIDGGEYLSLLNFRKDGNLISLGGYEVLYHSNKRNFAFDMSYIENGLEAYFFDTNYLDKFRLAISWIKLESNVNELSTWFASDPSLIK